MENKELRLLIDQIDQSSLSYFDYQSDSYHLILSKEMPEKKQPLQRNTEIEKSIPKTQGSQSEKVSIQPDPKELEEKEIIGETIDSPMVGVVYLQANPEEESFIKVGDQIQEGDTVCIIEAMKLMNEIQAPRSGEVVEILIENEDLVEFNQALIRIK